MRQTGKQANRQPGRMRHCFMPTWGRGANSEMQTGQRKQKKGKKGEERRSEQSRSDQKTEEGSWLCKLTQIPTRQ